MDAYDAAEKRPAESLAVASTRGQDDHRRRRRSNSRSHYHLHIASQIAVRMCWRLWHGRVVFAGRAVILGDAGGLIRVI